MCDWRSKRTRGSHSHSVGKEEETNHGGVKPKQLRVWYRHSYRQICWRSCASWQAIPKIGTLRRTTAELSRANEGELLLGWTRIGCRTGRLSRPRSCHVTQSRERSATKMPYCLHRHATGQRDRAVMSRSPQPCFVDSHTYVSLAYWSA